MKKLKVLFIGTGEFAIQPLQELLQSGLVELVGVVTQPDKPVGRKQELKGGPVKQFLLQLNEGGDFQIYQPEKLKESAEEILNESSPDLIVVAAYGQMVPDLMLDTPEYGAWNLHGSLLPELRGAVPVQMAILQGLTETGVTLQQMVKELDAGDILLQESVQIDARETTESLMGLLSTLAMKLLIQGLEQLLKGSLGPTEQDNEAATYCSQSDISKTKAEIVFKTEISQAERMIRAFYPWPVAWFLVKTKKGDKRVQVFAASIESTEVSDATELTIQRRGKSLFLQLESGELELLELQLEGKQRRPAAEYLFLGEGS